MNLPNAENLIESLKNKINEMIDENTVLIGVQRGGELILQKILPSLGSAVATGRRLLRQSQQCGKSAPKYRV